MGEGSRACVPEAYYGFCAIVGRRLLKGKGLPIKRSPVKNVSGALVGGC